MDRLISGALKRDRDKADKTVSYSANIFSMGAMTGGKTGGGKTGKLTGKK
jgi:hypothetical protein